MTSRLTTTTRTDAEAAAGDSPLKSDLTPVDVDPRVSRAMDKRERRLREQIAAELRIEAAKAAADHGNGKPRIPASWVPYLLFGSAVSAGLITTHEMLPDDVPRLCMVIGSFGLTVFGPLLAASAGLRRKP